MFEPFEILPNVFACQIKQHPNYYIIDHGYIVRINPKTKVISNKTGGLFKLRQKLLFQFDNGDVSPFSELLAVFSKRLIDGTLWKQIPNWPSYEVNALAQIRRRDTLTLKLNNPKNRWKNSCYSLWDNGFELRVSSKKLVRELFPECKPKPQPEVKIEDGVEYRLVQPHSSYYVGLNGKVVNHRTGRVLKHTMHEDSYPEVEMTHNKIRKHFPLHRLIATVFKDKFASKTEEEIEAFIVNHKNLNKTDFNSLNLEFMTVKENNDHAIQNGKGSKRAVLQIDAKTDEVIKTWPRIIDASRALEISSGSIVNCCKGMKWSKTSGGFKWKYVDPMERKAVEQEGEEWKILKHENVYANFYEISTFGRVRNNSNKNLVKPHFTNGYQQIALSTNSGPVSYYMQIIMASNFLPKPKDDGNLYDVDHKDEDRSNNRLDNLQYLTKSENSTKANGKPVIQIKDGVVINRFKSIQEASNETKISINSISTTAHGQQKHGGGFQWKFDETPKN
jgi:hypothetical protein